MQNPTTNVSQAPPKGEPASVVPGATATRQFVYIRVRRALLLPIRTTGTTDPPPPNPSESPTAGHLYLIEGSYDDIKRYAGGTVDWVIKVAHLICDPRGSGHVYTHTTGTSSDWYTLDRTSSWRQVVPGDPLLPGIYEFESTTPILLSEISERNTHSVTTAGSESSSTTFSKHIRLRDGARCVVTGVPNLLVASHLIPKRMGSDGAKAVVTRFAGVQAALDIQRFDPRIGILLFGTLDSLVDHYQLGLYHVTGNTYTLHNFDSDPDLSFIGVSRVSIFANSAIPPLHLYSVTLSVHDKDVSLPPKGVFDWHYLQCVIRVFGTPQYKNFLNIVFFTYPFKTSDDLDDEYPDDDEIEPSYPSYQFDKFLAEQGKRQMVRERHEELARWARGSREILL